MTRKRKRNPEFDVYAKVDVPNSRRSAWLKVGEAWSADDGNIDIHLAVSVESTNLMMGPKR